MLPITGSYSISDVDSSFDTNTSDFKDMAVSLKNSYTDTVTEDHNTGPMQNTDYIWYPQTTISRKGTKFDNKTFQFRSGFYRNYGGNGHGALDSGHLLSDRFDSACVLGGSGCHDTIIIAPTDGVFVGYSNGSGQYTTSGSGKASWFCMQMTDGPWKGYDAVMMHMSSINTSFKAGDTIKRGTYIGTLCSNGQSGGPHLHMNVAPHGMSSWGVNTSVHLKDWLKDCILYEGFSDVALMEPAATHSLDKQGYTAESIKEFNTKPHWSYDVVIPDVYKYK